MKPFISARRTVAAICLAASSLMATPGLATPASGFVGTQVAKGLYAPLDVKADKTDKWDLFLKSKDNSDVYVTRNAIAIDGQSGWHTHPGPSLITVTVGEIVAYESDDPLCQGKTYKAGEGFIDLGQHAHLLRNESGSAAETVAVQFLPTGATRRIDAEKPNNCSF